MTTFQLLAWPGTAPTIVVTTIALHYGMFSRRRSVVLKWLFIASALILPSLIALIAVRLMPAGEPRENLMPGLVEAFLLAFCVPLTVISTIAWLVMCCIRDGQCGHRSRRTTRRRSASRVMQTMGEEDERR